MKKIVLSVIVGFITISVWAQENPTPKSPTARKDKKAAKRDRINALLKQEEEGEIIFNKQSVFGLKLATDGYALTYEFGKFKSARVATLFQVELSEKKHKKEKRATLLSGFNFNSVVFGKLNNFYPVKLGMAQQRIIGGKGNKNGVAVMAIYGGGLSVGLLKPYFVDAEVNGERVRSKYPIVSDSGYDVAGASGFTVGWKELKVKPGAYVKAALRFDYGRFNETVSAIEVGINAEFYASKIPQIAYNKESRFFFAGYISLLIGRRR